MRNWTIAGVIVATLALLGYTQWSQAQFTNNIRQDARRPTVRVLQPSPVEQREMAIARQGGVRERTLGLISRLPKGQVDLAQINASHTPVMVLTQPLGDLRVFINAYHYTMTASQPGAQFELHGSSQAFTGPVAQPGAAAVPPPLPPINGFANLRVERSEVGIEVSWNRYGALYNLTISCDDPAHDPRCTPPLATAIALASVYVGGGQ